MSDLIWRDFIGGVRFPSGPFRRLAIEVAFAARHLSALAVTLSKARRGAPLTLADVVATRAGLARADRWRARQLARLADQKRPVAHLVKPSARRPGRRAHRRRTR